MWCNGCWQPLVKIKSFFLLIRQWKLLLYNHINREIHDIINSRCINKSRNTSSYLHLSKYVCLYARILRKRNTDCFWNVQERATASHVCILLCHLMWFHNTVAQPTLRHNSALVLGAPPTVKVTINIDSASTYFRYEILTLKH